MRHLVFFFTMPLALAAVDTPPPALPVTEGCQSYAETHTLVRNDVLAQLDAADQNLPKCEAALTTAQEELEYAEAALTQAKADLEALRKVALEQLAAIAELKAQKQVLEGHITKLESLTCPDPTIADQLAQGWEEVDGVVGLGAGYALGTGMCVTMAWVFNQPALRR